MTSPPDVVVIQVDQLRADCLGVTGNPDVATPKLDALAADGIVFDNAFCPFPVCTPSRYSLLSGLYPHQHGGLTNHSTLPPGIDTFPRALQRNGYRTTAVGKMHFTPTYLDVGYQRMVLAEQHGPGRYEDDYHRDLRAAGLAPVVDLIDQELTVRPEAPDWYWDSFGTRPSDLPERWHSTGWIGERAVREVMTWEPDRPQLLHVSFIKPHHPFDPPLGWHDRYRASDLTVLPGWTADLPAADHPWRQAFFDNDRLDEDRLRAVMAAYYGTVSHVDHQIGRLIAALRQQGRYDNALVVFTADHGEYLGFHHLLLKDGPMYDPVVRVPLIVKLPGNHHGGTRDRRLTSSIDVAPTVLSVTRAGLAPPPPGQEWRADAARELPGIDLTDPSAGREHVFAIDRRGDLSYLIRSASHKLVMGPRGDLLFDLRGDPLETHNLHGRAEHAEVERRLRDAGLRWLQFDAPVPPHVDEHAAVIDAANLPDTDPDAVRAHRDYFLSAVRRSLTDPPN